jgi:hypothetical protein
MSETATGGETSVEDKFEETYIALETAIIDVLFEVGGTRYDDEEEALIYGDALSIIQSVMSSGFAFVKGDVTIGRR